MRASDKTRHGGEEREDRGYDAVRGAVAEWLGRGLQSLVQRFDSARRLRMRATAVMVVLAALAVAPTSAAGASLVPRGAERAIARSVPRPFAFVPARAPVGWRYQAWDAGRETPGLFPRGRGLNIWFSTPPYPKQFCSHCLPRQSKGAGFHAYADGRCSASGAMATFHIGRNTVAWSATAEDALAWECVRVRHLLVRVSVSFAGIGLSPHAARAEQIAKRHGAAVARMVASARLLHTG